MSKLSFIKSMAVLIKAAILVNFNYEVALTMK